jgi:hypothetical protein
LAFIPEIKAQSTSKAKLDSLSAYHLKMAGSCLKTSGLLQLGAGTFAGFYYVIPLTTSTNPTGNGFQARKVLLFAGGFCEFVSLLEYFSASDHLQKAGALQLRNGGVSYRF